MRTSDERISAMHTRAAEISRHKRARKVRVMQAAGAVVSFAAVIMLAVFMPRLADLGEGRPDGLVGQAGSMHASAFGDSTALGYIVIAVIAFLLGVALTIFCFRLRQWQARNDNEDPQ